MNTYEATYEAANRTRKALKLADTFRILISKTGASVEDVAQLPESAWLTVAKVAKVNPPSEATRAVVLELLRHETCGMGVHFSCGLPARHTGLHDFEDPAHAARVEAFLDAQDAAKGERVAS